MIIAKSYFSIEVAILTNGGEMVKKRLLILAVGLAVSLALALAYASVQSYLPANVSVTPTTPAVVFEVPSSSIEDLAGAATINVGQNKTSLSIKVHPTYEVTYYKNITLIKNTGSKQYNVSIEVASPLQNLPSGSKAYLVIFPKGAQRSLTGWPPSPQGYIALVDLTRSGTTTIGSLNSGDELEVDLYFYIPEGSRLPQQDTANIYLVVSP